MAPLLVRGGDRNFSIVHHPKPINSCICYQDRMETLCLDVPLLDPTGDFSGPRKSMCETPIQTCNCTLSGSLQKRTVTALAQTLTSVAKAIPQMCLIWKNLTKRTDFGALTKGVDPRTLERDGSANPNEEVPGIDLPGGMKALHSLANVPKSWPLARLTIPLSAASKHLERLLEGCWQLPSGQRCVDLVLLVSSPDKSHYASEWLQRPRDPSWQGTRHKGCSSY